MTQEEMIQKIKKRIEYHADEKKYGYFLGRDVIDYLAKDILRDLQIAELTARAERAEAELKEAVEDLTNVCTPGVHCWPCGKFGICDGRCIMNGGFQWRGLSGEGGQ